MVLVDYDRSRAWHDARLAPFGSLTLSPAASVLHYGQQIFEGLKAYRDASGGIRLFRIEHNARRFQASAQRLAMPPLPEPVFIAAVEQLVQADREWLPSHAAGTLYLRPFQIATQATIEMHPSDQYLFGVIACRVGVPAGPGPVMRITVSEQYVRAAPGGTGAAKCGGNYAASMPALAEADRAGYDQVVFLDAVERRYVEELGGMNVFLVLDDGTLVTPPLSDTILPGVTRDSVLQLARYHGRRVVEQPVGIEDWARDATTGRVVEAFACGTSAVISAIGAVRFGGTEFIIGDEAPGPVVQTFRRSLLDIQHGRADDPFGWTRLVD